MQKHQEKPNHETGFSYRAPQPGEPQEVYAGRVAKAKARYAKLNGQGRAVHAMLGKKKVAFGADDC